MLTIVWKDQEEALLFSLIRELNRNGVYCERVRGGLKIAEAGTAACYAISRFLVRDVLKEAVYRVAERFFPVLEEREICYIAQTVAELATRRKMGETAEFLCTIAKRVRDSVTGEIWNVEGFLMFRMQDVMKCYQDFLEDVICYMASRGGYHQTVRHIRSILRKSPRRYGRLTVCRLAKDRYALCDETGTVVSFNKRGGEELLAAVIEAAPEQIVLRGCRELAHTACLEVLRSVYLNNITVVDN